jgi:hypothetical protein
MKKPEVAVTRLFYLPGLQKFIIRNFRLLFTILGLAFVLLTATLLKDHGCFCNPYASSGLFSFKTSFEKPKTDSILTNWKNDFCYCKSCACEQAAAGSVAGKKGNNCSENAIVLVKKNVVTDFIFIPVYILFFILLIVRLQSLKDEKMFFSIKTIPTSSLKGLSFWNLFFCCMIIVAGLFDVFENYFTLYAIRHISDLRYNPSHTAAPALISMVYFTGVVLYIAFSVLPWISENIKKVSYILFQYRIVVIGLLLIFAILWTLDQGQDLLINLHVYRSGPGVLIIVLSILALLNWYLPKMYEQSKLKNTNPAFKISSIFNNRWDFERESADFNNEIDIARMFGVSTFLIPACAIPNTLNVFNVTHLLKFISPMVLLLLLLIVSGLAIHQKWITRFYNTTDRLRITTVPIILNGCLFAWVIFDSFFRKHPYPGELSFLGVNLVIMAYLFLSFTELRNDRTIFGINFTARKVNYMVWVPSLLLIVAFVFINIYPIETQIVLKNWGSKWRFMALPVLITGIIFYTVLFSLMLLYGRRFKINILLVFFVFAFIMSNRGNNNFHDVRMNPLANNKVVPLDSLQTMVGHWLEHRKKEITEYKTRTGKNFPLFLVNSYGGGIRAAVWTNLVLSYLDSSLRIRNHGVPFSHYVLAQSGISGGAIGLSIATVYKAVHGFSNTENQYNTKQHWLGVYQQDYLSPVLAGLLGRDVFCSVLGVNAGVAKDRSAIQEKLWERNLKQIGQVSYDTSFRNVWYPHADPALYNTNKNRYDSMRYEIPLLFINTYHVESGKQGILAPVLLNENDFTGATFINNLPNFKTGDIPFSTGSFLSARFPYMSPAGRFGYQYHFLDGGLKEYSGAATINDVLKVLEKMKISQQESLLNLVDIYILSLPNSSAGEINAGYNNPLEFLAPLSGIMKNNLGNTERAEEINRFSVKENNYFNIRPSNDCVPLLVGKEKICYRPVLPLGWQISDEAIRRLGLSLDKELEKQNSSLNNLLQIWY